MASADCLRFPAGLISFRLWTSLACSLCLSPAIVRIAQPSLMSLLSSRTGSHAPKLRRKKPFASTLNVCREALLNEAPMRAGELIMVPKVGKGTAVSD